ncbi:MAG: tyrosine-type recombinase/integrase [Myxococcota bacterium]
MPVVPERRIPRVLDLWLEDIERRYDISDATKLAYWRTTLHLRAWGRLRALQHLDLHPYVRERLDKGVAPRTLALELRVIRIFFRWARDNRHIPSTANLRCPRLKIDRSRFVENHATPTPSEAARVIEAMPDDDWKLATVLLARTGARIGEVVRLRSCDLDEVHGRLAFGACEGASKTGMRWFPLDADTRTLLAGRGGHGDAPLLHLEGTGNRGAGRVVVGAIQALGRRLRVACDVAGVPRFTPHGLRRMVVSRLLRARIDAATAASLTGHSIQVMLRHYQVISDDDRRDAVEAANLGALVDPPRSRAA